MVAKYNHIFSFWEMENRRGKFANLQDNAKRQHISKKSKGKNVQKTIFSVSFIRATLHLCM